MQTQEQKFKHILRKKIDTDLESQSKSFNFINLEIRSEMREKYYTQLSLYNICVKRFYIKILKKIKKASFLFFV
jgi:hypothetical protein